MKNTPFDRALVWIRRDLRLVDSAALAEATRLAKHVVIVFIFDTAILQDLPEDDRRLSFIHESLEEVDRSLRARGSALVVRHGNPVLEIAKLVAELGIDAVFTNRDYEPKAKIRDEKVKSSIGAIPLFSFKDQVIFESREIVSATGNPYRVFTPYKNAWLKAFKKEFAEEQKVDLKNLIPIGQLPLQDWSLARIGFTSAKLWLASGQKAAEHRLKAFQPKISNYEKSRDFPGVDGTSGLSVHLRFGTVSIRAAVRTALAGSGDGAKVWLSELIWRDFYHMILDQFPHAATGAFKAEYQALRWPGKRDHFELWTQGQTGYPIVDAAMRHFNRTGWMHNRLRMIVASFLTKDLLCHWQWGEEYFAKNLLDFDLAANNGGWQWAASTGCDAQPYFRIFNPISQSERFDPDGVFIRQELPEAKKWSISELHEAHSPIIDHAIQREKALKLFKGK